MSFPVRFLSPALEQAELKGGEQVRRCSANQDCTTWNAVPVLAATPLGLVQGIVRATAVLPAH